MLTFEVLLVGDAPTAPEVREGFPPGLVETATVADVDEVLSLVERSAVDCIVSDYELSEGDGIDLLSAVRERDRHLPFVLYTAHGDEGVATAAIDADVTAYVPRTAEDDAVDSLVERVVEAARRHHVTAAVSATDPIAADLQVKELAMDEAPVGITIVDPSEPDEPLVYVNRAFERLTGYGEYEVLGRNCRFLQGEETDPGPVAELRHAIAERRPVSVELLNYRKDGEPFWNQVHVAPVEDGDDELFVGFQTDVTDRKDVELRAARQAEELRADQRTRERLLARLDGLVQRVTEATVDATSRSELERRVCEAFVETDEYGAAWIGSREMTTDRVVATAEAGCGAVDDLQVPTDGDDPVAVALESSRVVVVETETLPASSVHERLAGPEGGVAAVPLRYGEAEYGVLVVYAAESTSLDEHEQAVFDALGRVVGTGINALENQRLLLTDEYLELVFEATEAGPFLLDLAREADCELTYNGTVVGTDGRFTLSVTATHTTPERLRSAAETLSSVEELTVVGEYEEACLLQVVPAEGSLVRTVLDHNGSVRSMTVSGAGIEIRVELPRASNPGAVVERLQERYEGLSLRSQRRTEREQKTREELLESLEAALTDRQLEAVQKAYLSDYFEWPRPVSGDDIAQSMGISRSTFHQHLRAAESKIIGELLADRTSGTE